MILVLRNLLSYEDNALEESEVGKRWGFLESGVLVHLCNNGDLIWDGSEWRYRRVDKFKVYFIGKTDHLENMEGKKENIQWYLAST